MSTRAIIGIRNNDGTITGAWCWNDGYDIIESLRKDFITKESIDFLLKLGMFNTIFTEESAADYKKWCKNQGIDCSDKEFYEYGNSLILQDERYKDREAETYKDMKDALGQDINVLYIADGKGGWEIYGDYEEDEQPAEPYIDKVKELAKSEGWNVDYDDSSITFQTYTTYGQDCSFTLDIEERAEDFCDSLYNYYDSFDVSTETYYWLDSEGHGANGAPYDMMDVYNDMAEYKDKIEELWKTVRNAIEKED